MMKHQAEEQICREREGGGGGGGGGGGAGGGGGGRHGCTGTGSPERASA